MKADSSKQKSTSWRRCAQGDLRIEPLADAYIAFHRPSGKTHLLNDSSVALLESLTIPRTLDEIADLTSPSSLLPVPDEFVDRLATMLTSLEDLGLVERA